MRGYQKLEKYYRLHQQNPVEKFEYRGYEVYLSEGGPYYEKSYEFPLGWYESAYAIGKNETPAFYQPLLFDRLHDKSMTDESRRIARINSARKAAKEYIDGIVQKNQ